jgi:quaternary ammonium compound-resistance protein SugE
MKFTNGFSTRPWVSLATFGISIVSFLLLALAMRTLPLGTSYAVWTGLGAAGTAIIGIAVFREPATLLRILCLAMIIGGIVGLKLTARV